MSNDDVLVAFQIADQQSQLAGDESAPLELIFGGLAARQKHDEVPVSSEELRRFEQLVPAALRQHYVFGYVQADSELLHDDRSRGSGDVVRAVLLRVGRSDDGHQMIAIGHVDAGIPNGKAEVDGVGLLQENGLRPLPLREH